MVEIALTGAFAPSPLIAFAGDSVTAATVAANTSLLTMNTQRGMQFWVPFLLKKRARSRPDLNFGVNGDTSAALLDRIGAVCASDAQIVVVQIGTNDIGALTLAQSKANIDAIVSSLLAAGKHVILLPPLARSLATAAYRGHLFGMIRYVEEKRFSGTRNLVVISTAAAYIDPLSATGAPKSGLSYDGLHPVARGDYYTSLDVVAYLDKLLPPAAAAFFSVADSFSAGNPTGNLLANGILDGTSGTFGGLDGGASSGVIATGLQWTYSDNGGDLAGLTTTGTKITHPVDGRPGQRIRIAGTYTGAASATLNTSTVGILQQNFASFTNFQIGDVIRARVEVTKNLAASPEQMTGLELQLNCTQAGQVSRRAEGSSYGDLLPEEAFSGVMETPTITLTAAPTTFVWSVRAYLRSGSRTIDSSFDIYGAKLEKVD